MALQQAALYLAYVKTYYESTRDSLPKLDNKGKLTGRLDPARHPSFIYTLPNPTIATAAFDPLRKGLNNFKPEHFYGLNSRLVVWAPRIYFNHLDEAAAVRCPLCSKVAKALSWGQHLRRVCALQGTFFLVGTRHICRNCEGLKAGKTFQPSEAGDVAADLQAVPIDDEPEDGQLDRAAAAAAAAATPGSSAAAAAARAPARQKKAAKKPPQQQQQQQEEEQQEQQQQQQQQQGAEGQEKKQKKNLTFMSYDRQVLEQMPAFVREQVPFLTTAKGAIDTTLLQLLKLLAVSDVGFSTLVSRLEELHHWQYYKQMLVYYSFAAVVKEVEHTRRTASGAGQGSVAGFTVPRDGSPPATFVEPPAFGDKAAAAVHVPGAPWVTDVFVASTEADRRYMLLWMAALCGMILKLDHSFKVVKRVRDATAHKQFGAVLTVMNEFCQVLACFPAQTKSLTELEPELAKIMANYEKMGAAFEEHSPCGPWAAYVDDAAAVEGQLRHIFPLLQHVLADITHVMRRFNETLTPKHCQAGDFMRDLSKAIFVLLANDEAALRQHHATGDSRYTLTPEELEQKGAKYWHARCRRMVRAPADLKSALQTLMAKYADARDPERGNQPLFTQYTQQVYEAVLQLIDSGSFCDPLPVERMYIAVQKVGCMIRYVAMRGTSQLEGYHKHLIDLFVGANYSARLAGAMVTMFNFRYSVHSGIRNRGDPDFGMVDFWMLDEIKEVCSAAGFEDPLQNFQSQYKEAKAKGLEPLVAQWDSLAGNAEAEAAAAAAAAGVAAAAGRMPARQQQAAAALPDVEADEPGDFWDALDGSAPRRQQQQQQQQQAGEPGHSQQQPVPPPPPQQQQQQPPQHHQQQHQHAGSQAGSLLQLQLQVQQLQLENQQLLRNKQEQEAEISRLKAELQGRSEQQKKLALNHKMAAQTAMQQQQQQQYAMLVTLYDDALTEQAALRAQLELQQPTAAAASAPAFSAAAAFTPAGAPDMPTAAGVTDSSTRVPQSAAGSAGGTAAQPSGAAAMAAAPTAAAAATAGGALPEMSAAAAAGVQEDRQEQAAGTAARHVSGGGRLVSFAQHYSRSLYQGHPRRQTYADTAVAVSTPAERSLWRKLYFSNTKKNNTSWKTMLRDWNRAVELHMQQQQPATVTAKTEYLLKQHEGEELRALAASLSLPGFVTSVCLEMQASQAVPGLGAPLTEAEARLYAVHLQQLWQQQQAAAAVAMQQQQQVHTGSDEQAAVGSVGGRDSAAAAAAAAAAGRADGWDAAAAAAAVAGGASGWESAAAAAAAAGIAGDWNAAAAAAAAAAGSSAGCDPAAPAAVAGSASVWGSAAAAEGVASEAGFEQQPGGRKRAGIGAAAMLGKKQRKTHRAHRCTQCGRIKKEAGKASHASSKEFPGRFCQHACITCEQPMTAHTTICNHEHKD